MSGDQLQVELVAADRTVWSGQASRVIARTTEGLVAKISDFGGVQKAAPVLAGLFLVAGLSGLSLPGLSTFVSEFLVIVGTFERYRWAGALAVSGVVLAAIYILWMYQRTMTGPVAFSSTAWETEPSSSPRKPPMPREPTTTMSAECVAFIRMRAGRPTKMWCSTVSSGCCAAISSEIWVSFWSASWKYRAWLNSSWNQEGVPDRAPFTETSARALPCSWA